MGSRCTCGTVDEALDLCTTPTLSCLLCIHAVLEQNCLKLRSVMEAYPSVAIRPHAKVDSRTQQQQCLCWLVCAFACMHVPDPRAWSITAGT